MTTNKNFMMLAVLGVGAYLLTTRKASAGTLPAVGSAPRINPVPPVVYRQNPTNAIARPAGNDGLVAAGVNLFNSIFSAGNAPIYRTPDFNPGYYPDNAGEAAARTNYLNNPDAFAANPPLSFNPDPQLYVATGGYLDSQ